MNKKFCQIQLTLDAIKIISYPSVFNLTTPLQLFQCSEVKDYSYFKMRYDMPSQMISMIKKRGVWTSQKKKTKKKTAHLHRQFPNEMGGGGFKRVLSKEITGKAIDQGKILKWSMALGRPQIRIPKKSKDKYKEFS